MAGETKFLANVFSQIVSHDIVVDGTTLARAGDRIILVPVTTYRAVMVGDVSLEDLWPTVGKSVLCQTSGDNAAKTVTCDGFTLAVGARVSIRFANANAAADPTLNVNNTGTFPIYCHGAAIATNLLQAGTAYTFVWNGTNFEMEDGKVCLKHVETLPASVPSDLAEGGILIVG